MNRSEIKHKSQILIIGSVLIFGLSVLPVFATKHITKIQEYKVLPDTLTNNRINDTIRLEGTSGSYTTASTTILPGPALFSDLKKDFKIYPNPVKNMLNLTFNADRALDGILLIRDILGKEVKRFSFEISPGSNRFSFPVDDFYKGIYFAEFYTLKKRILTKKIIKE